MLYQTNIFYNQNRKPKHKSVSRQYLQLLLTLAFTLSLISCDSGGSNNNPSSITEDRFTDEGQIEKKLTIQQSGLLAGQQITVDLTIKDSSGNLVNEGPIFLSTTQTTTEIILEPGALELQVQTLPNGISCQIPDIDTASETDENMIELSIHCDSASVKQLQAHLDLGTSTDVSGAELKLQGIVGNPVALSSPGMEILISESASFNGKSEQVEVELSDMIIREKTYPIEILNIATNLNVQDTNQAAYFTDENGNISISYDARLFNRTDTQNITLLIATFQCPEITTNAPECQLKQPVHTVLTPEQFIAGNWRTNALTETAYRRLQYYVLAGYSVSEMTPYMDLLAQYIFKEDPNQATATYTDFLSWSTESFNQPTSGKALYYPYIVKDINQLLQAEETPKVNETISERISTLFTPVVYELTTDIASEAIYLANDIAYLASDSGLQVVDITNPAKPIFLSALTNLGSDIKDIVVKNDLAYVALGNAGIGIIDISNPQSPTLISTFATKTGLFGSASSIDVSGDYAYVATGDSIQVINISNPDDPSFTTKINIDRTIFCLDGVRHVKVLEDKVYAGLHCGAELYVDWVIPWWPLKATGLYISDISNPTSPGEPEPVEKVSSFVRSMAVSDTSIYVSSGTDFYIISHPNPGIREVSGPFYASSLIESIAYKNEKLYVGTRGVGIEIYAAEYLSKDKENSSPSTESFIVTPDEMTDIQVLDDTIFVTNKNTIDNQHGNLIIYNQLRANQPVFSDNRVDTPGFAHTVSILNNSVYIADGRSGLQIASIDENKRMTLSTKGKDTDGYSYDLLIDAPFIYLSDGFNGTKIYTPNEEFGPLEVGSISPPKFTLFNLIIAKIEASVLSGKLAKKGNIIFTGQFPGLDIIDVSQPDAPISIDSSTFDGEFVGGTQFLVNGDIGYALVNTLAFSDGTLPGSLIKDVPSFQIYDLQNPASPTRIGFIDIQDFPADVRSIAVNGNYAFVACGIDGIRVVNTADKTAPYVVHALDTPGTAMDVLIDQNILYLATNTHGLAIYDISNPVDLKLLGTAETAGLATGLTFHEDSIFVATGNTGVMQLNKIKLPQ